jgi:hypothetical protein
VAAFHVVGVDFELGLGVDRRARAQHEVAAELVRIDLLGTRPNRDAALKGAVGAPRGNSLENFASFAARCHVVDRGDDVCLLATRQHKGAVERALGRLPLAPHDHLVPHCPAAQQQDKTGKP